MLRVLGSPRQLCEGLTRRDMLRIGGLGLAGLSLADVLRLQAVAAPGKDSHFGRAKSVILLHLRLAQPLEWADPSPSWSSGASWGRSASPPIAASGTAAHPRQVMDKTTVIGHDAPVSPHGWRLPTGTGDRRRHGLETRDPRHWPYFGSVVEYLDRQRATPIQRVRSPGNIAPPFMGSNRMGEVPRRPRRRLPR